MVCVQFGQHAQLLAAGRRQQPSSHHIDGSTPDSPAQAAERHPHPGRLLPGCMHGARRGADDVAPPGLERWPASASLSSLAELVSCPCCDRDKPMKLILYAGFAMLPRFVTSHDGWHGYPPLPPLPALLRFVLHATGVSRPAKTPQGSPLPDWEENERRQTAWVSSLVCLPSLRRARASDAQHASAVPARLVSPSRLRRRSGAARGAAGAHLTVPASACQ